MVSPATTFIDSGGSPVQAGRKIRIGAMIMPPPMPSKPERNPETRLARPMILNIVTTVSLFIIDIINSSYKINRQNLYWLGIYILSIFTLTPTMTLLDKLPERVYYFNKITF